jgi:hypothetical protein
MNIQEFAHVKTTERKELAVETDPGGTQQGRVRDHSVEPDPTSWNGELGGTGAGCPSRSDRCG